MKFFRLASAAALAAIIAGPAAVAVTLQQAAQPAETPPASYTGDVYVDSRGCAYARAMIGNTVNWVPRLASDRKSVICGLTPTAQVASMTGSRITPPPPPPPPPATPATAPATPTTEAAAPMRTALAPAAPAPVVSEPDPSPAAISRTMSVTCPADGSAARLRIGGSTVSVQCRAAQVEPASFIVRDSRGARTRVIVNPPAPVVLAQAPAATSTERVRIGGVKPGSAGPLPSGYAFGNGYGLSNYPGAYDPVPQPVPVPGGVVARPNAPGSLPGSGSGNSYGSGYNLAPVPDAGRVVIPEGYVPAWEDGRLNPNRGPRSVVGDLQMAQTMTIDKVPMRTVNAAPTRGLIAGPQTTVVTKSVTSAAPAKRYVQVGMFSEPGNAQRAAAKLQSLGLPGRIAQTASGKTVVIAGPYDSVAALDAALATARRGFPDAFPRN